MIVREVYIAEEFIYSHILVYCRDDPCRLDLVRMCYSRRVVDRRSDRALIFTRPSLIGQATRPRSSSGIGRRNARAAMRVGMRAKPLLQHE